MLANSGTYDLFARLGSTPELAPSDSATVPVTLALSTATVTVSVPSAVTVGANATLEATVSPTCAGGVSGCAAGGTVTFYLGNSTSGTSLGTSAALSGNGTTATVSVSTSSGTLGGAGTYSGITAKFNGSSKVAAADSGNSVDLVVNQSTPNVTMPILHPLWNSEQTSVFRPP